MPPNQSNVLLYENEDVEKVSSFEKQGYRTTPLLFVNGTQVPTHLAVQARPNQTLLSFLREIMLITGPKLGCAEGGCGACTVMISKLDKQESSIQHYSVNACLMPVLAADGCHVTTVEGIGTVKNSLHPAQQAMVDMHGSQCGFCTPGFVVSIYALLAKQPAMVANVEEHFDGNLCRCTGHRPIWDAARSLCEDGAEAVRGPCGTPCRECPEQDECQQDCNVQDKEQQKQEGMCCSSSKDKMSTYKDTFLANKESWINQPNDMFPKELSDPTSSVSVELAKPLVVVDKTDFHAGGTWFKPTTLMELLRLLKEFDGACKIVVGNTEVGIETKFKHAVYPRLISPSTGIQELYGFDVTEDTSTLVIGSCCPLSTIQHKCETLGQGEIAMARTVLPMHDMLRWFASTQIRNVACLGGNLVTASPISDMNPLLASMGAKLVLASLDESTVTRRSLKVSDFFLKYRTVDLKPKEVVERIEVPVLQKVFEYLRPFKQARRREDDISIVTSGMRIRLGIKDGKFVIEDMAMAFGGMAPTTVLASKAASVMVGAEFCAATFELGKAALLEEMNLPLGVPGGQAAFRMTLAASFLHKFYLAACADLKVDVETIQADPSKFPNVGDLPPLPLVDALDESGTYNFLSAPKPSITGTQVYPEPKVVKGLEETTLPKVKEMPAKASAVGKASHHQSGPLHCTGEALYTDDIPLPPQTLQAALVLSDQCGGIFESIDTAPALAIPGVVGVYTHKDIVALGGSNELGPIVHDETVFLPLGETVNQVAKCLGVVVAESLESAELGARMVKIKYGEVKDKIIVTVDDAIAAGSFYEFSRHGLEIGEKSVIDELASTPDTEGAPKVGDIVKISGSFRSGAQEHFYLETNSTLVVPSEAATNLTIYCSTQAATKTQNFCAAVTGTPASKVVVRVKRMGGGFGGKETRSVPFSCAAAVAAKMTDRPVRLTLSREVDMKTTGTRHVFVSNYKASAKVTEEGVKLVALDVQIYANGGSGFDLSGPVTDRALFHIENCYYWPNLRSEGIACKTVQPPHTAYRGFGGPQGMVIAEHIMDHLSVVCGTPGDDLRRQNMYTNGDPTPFGMVIGEHSTGKWNVPDMWDRLYEETKVKHRRACIEEFNAKHRWIKRGIAMVPTKFGINYTAKFMNQGGALVHLYTDGTVLVSHGGTEMGQGLHTKVCQVAAQAFGIPIEDVYVNDSSTDKVANTIPTAASMSTDMYGMATLDACRQILARLAPVIEELGPEAPLKDVAQKAHFSRIDLTAHGFFAVDDSRCGFDWFAEKPEDCPEDAPTNSWKGHPFNYFTQGVVCTEVEVDLLSGSHRTLQSDLLVDVGSSINPAIDIGQIEGAFTQGMGWSTIEEVTYADDDHSWIRPRGKVFTTGPGTYKIPSLNDTPEIWNVSLYPAENPFAVHSSKAVGEPPFFLGSCVFYAIKDAIMAARKQNLGESAYFELRMPATSERIRMHCADAIVGMAAAKVYGDEEKKVDVQPQGSY